MSSPAVEAHVLKKEQDRLHEIGLIGAALAAFGKGFAKMRMRRR